MPQVKFSDFSHVFLSSSSWLFLSLLEIYSVRVKERQNEWFKRCLVWWSCVYFTILKFIQSFFFFSYLLLWVWLLKTKRDEVREREEERERDSMNYCLLLFACCLSSHLFLIQKSWLKATEDVMRIFHGLPSLCYVWLESNWEGLVTCQSGPEGGKILLERRRLMIRMRKGRNVRFSQIEILASEHEGLYDGLPVSVGSASSSSSTSFSSSYNKTTTFVCE